MCKARQSFSRSSRITRKEDFARLLGAARISNKWFVVYMQNNGTGTPRLGIIVSKRTMSRAVSRNFAKRLVREVFRRDSPSVGGWDVLVRARKQIGPETSEEGRKALKQLLQAVQA